MTARCKDGTPSRSHTHSGTCSGHGGVAEWLDGTGGSDAAPGQPQSGIISTTCPNGTYENVDGNAVCRPFGSPVVPAGATAQCNDGTYSMSQNRQGTCSSHGGVRQFLAADPRSTPAVLAVGAPGTCSTSTCIISISPAAASETSIVAVLERTG